MAHSYALALALALTLGLAAGAGAAPASKQLTALAFRGGDAHRGGACGFQKPFPSKATYAAGASSGLFKKGICGSCYEVLSKGAVLGSKFHPSSVYQRVSNLGAVYQTVSDLGAVCQRAFSCTQSNLGGEFPALCYLSVPRRRVRLWGIAGSLHCVYIEEESILVLRS